VRATHGEACSHQIIGTVEQYPDEDAARRSVVGLVSELNTGGRPTNSGTMTVIQLCDHFEQRELAKENTWRSHATKKIYKAHLTRWIRPQWKKYQLAEVRTIQVESWLRGLPLAKSSCAKIRNVMSVLFNHACRYELFDRNPIYLVRQSAKRRTPPATLVPAEIKALIDGLALRERTLVLLAASTGLRQSEIFGLKWGDIDFERGTMSVIRSIVYGVVGPCKTESSQKPVPMHPTLADALIQWNIVPTSSPRTGFLQASAIAAEDHTGDRRSCANTYAPRHSEPEFRSDSDGIRSGTPSQPCCEAWGLSSR
jgi:integrase